MNQHQTSMLITQSSTINRYFRAAQDAQRGFSRLHRKIRQREQQMEDLKEFLADRQLIGEWNKHESEKRTQKRIKYTTQQPTEEGFNS